MGKLLCLNQLDGVGVSCEKLTPLTGLRLIVLARPGFSFDDSEDFATLASWNTAIANKDVLVIPNASSQENQKVEDGINTSPYGDETFLWSGMRGLRLLFLLTLDQHKILKTYSDKNWTLFRLDRNNNIVGVKNDDGTISGFTLSYFHVFDQLEPTEGEPCYTPIKFQEIDPGEYNAKGCYVNPVWRVINLDPITKVTLTCSTVDTFVFTATVAYVPESTFEKDGTALSSPVSGLVAADFQVIDQAGDIEVCTAEESETVLGTYTITGVDITEGSCQVIPTADDLYESEVEILTAAP